LNPIDGAGFSANSVETLGSGQPLILPTALSSLAPYSTASVDSAGGNLATAVGNAPLENTGLATLSYLLGLSLLWRGLNVRPHEIAATTRRKSQTGSKPEPPPPRIHSHEALLS
jgi:hypothetical protein